MQTRITKIFPFLILAGITCVFFYKTLIFRLLPFPGDLLVSEYQPWRSYSFLGYNPGSYPSKKQYFDTIRQIYPWRTFVNQELKQGRIPLWNPHNFSGHPLLANLQSQVFYPFTVLYFIFSQPMAWTILVMLQPFLAMIGMFLYLRSIHRSIYASLICSLSYGFSHYMTVFLEYNTIGHVILWIPFILYSIEKIHETKKTIFKTLLVFSIASSAVAGHLQIFGGIAIFAILYALVIKKPVALDIIILLIIGMGIAGIQLIPTIELLYHSARVNHPYEDFVTRLLIQPKQLLTFINPDLFGNPATENYLLHDSYPGKALFVGFLIFFFSVLSSISKKKTPWERFFLFLSIILLFLLTRNPITELLYRVPIPLVLQSGPGNFIIFITFTLTTLASFGIDKWMKHAKTNIAYGIILGLISIIFIGALTNSTPHIRSMVIFSLLSFSFLSILLFVSKFIRKKVLLYATFLFTAFELFYFFHKFNPFVPVSLIYPETPLVSFLKQQRSIGRLYGYGHGAIEANFATQLGLYDPNGYDPLYPKSYGIFIYGEKNKPFAFNQSTRSDATIIPGFGDEPFDSNKKRKELIDGLGVEYIISGKENNATERTFPPSEYPIVYQDDVFIVYKNMTAQPRLSFSSPDNQGTTNILLYKSTVVELEVSSPIRQHLILSDTYMPGWKAFVNGEKVPFVQSSHPFREIEIPEGKHIVKFEYAPLSFIVGIGISSASITFFIFFINSKKRKIVS